MKSQVDEMMKLLPPRSTSSQVKNRILLGYGWVGLLECIWILRETSWISRVFGDIANAFWEILEVGGSLGVFWRCFVCLPQLVSSMWYKQISKHMKKLFCFWLDMFSELRTVNVRHQLAGWWKNTLEDTQFLWSSVRTTHAYYRYICVLYLVVSWYQQLVLPYIVVPHMQFDNFLYFCFHIPIWKLTTGINFEIVKVHQGLLSRLSLSTTRGDEKHASHLLVCLEAKSSCGRKVARRDDGWLRAVNISTWRTSL